MSTHLILKNNFIFRWKSFFKNDTLWHDTVHATMHKNILVYTVWGHNVKYLENGAIYFSRKNNFKKTITSYIFFKTKGFVRWFHEKLTIIMKCLVGMSKVNAPCNSIVEILWCGSAAAKAHVCVRTYVMTASASADLKELPLLRSSFDMIQKFVCFVFNWGGIKPRRTPDQEGPGS